jgi:Leucine-rich repeat (LRR) protein
VSFNHLERLPDMGSLPHLTALNLQGNSIAHVEHLARFPLLQSLDLSINRVDSLPSLCSELMSVTEATMQQRRA